MKKLRPKYVFFDVANTLLYKPGLVDCISGVLRGHEIRVAPDVIRQRHKILSEFVRFPDKTSRTFYHDFNRELLLALGVLPESHLIDEIYSACARLEWRAFEDVNFLREIEIPVGIISNWDSSLIERIGKHVCCDFDRVISSSEAGCQKPDGLIFDTAVEGIQCEREQILYVGDSIQMDYLGARDAGLTSVLIDRECVYPDFNGKIVRSLRSLREMIG